MHILFQVSQKNTDDILEFSIVIFISNVLTNLNYFLKNFERF